MLADRLPPRLRLETGIYVTDERNLFRCVSVAPTQESGATALLEDCLTLELLVIPLAELDSDKLRIVQPAMGGAGLEPATSCL
jgi:hypothetical protein